MADDTTTRIDGRAFTDGNSADFTVTARRVRAMIRGGGSVVAFDPAALQGGPGRGAHYDPPRDARRAGYAQNGRSGAWFVPGWVDAAPGAAGPPAGGGA